MQPTSPPPSPTPVAHRRFRSVLASVLALAVTAFTLVFVPGPLPAAADDWGAEILLAYNDDVIGDGNFGDLPMPDCGSRNITGHFRLAKWSIRTEQAPGIVLEGSEWDVEVRMQSAWSAPPYRNDGPDPLVVSLPATGGVERVGPIVGTYGDAGLLPYHAHFGDGWTGAVKSIGTWGYAYDANSSPKGFDGSDGVNLTMRYRIRATGPAPVKIDKLVVTGHDGSFPAGPVNCTVPVNWTWGVAGQQAPAVVGETAKVDATYFGDNPGDANGGDHEILIDVLANDDDLNIAGGPGSTDQVRLAGWSVASLEGGHVHCGNGKEPYEINPTEDAWNDLPTGPCSYQPPQDYEGPDVFQYDVVQKTGRKIGTAQVNIQVVRNRRPIVLPAQFAVPQNTDEVLSLQGVVGDYDGDPLTCLPGLVAPVAPAVGTVTMNGDCTFAWDNQDALFTGNVSFGFRACDTHATVKGKGQLGPAVTPAPDYHHGWPNDLDASHTRRCADGTANITVSQGGIFPPMGVMDLDVVDAGYAGDGVGPYTVDLDVIANDWDVNGPVDHNSVTVQVLDGPDPSEGTTMLVNNRIRFTPTDGFSGPVTFTYRICEDPELQNPPYEGFPFCGVGGVSLDVVGNEAPVANGTSAEIPDGTNVSVELAMLAFDPEGGDITCTDVTAPPGTVTSVQWYDDCGVDITFAPGQHGAVIPVTYTVCDEHLLSHPAQPGDPYGADGRSPGDVAPRCSEGTIDVAILDEVPGPQDPDPEVPGPEDPDPEDPDPQDPDPEDPDPEDPDPQDPEGDDPDGEGDEGDGGGEAGQPGDGGPGHGGPGGSNPGGGSGDGAGSGSGSGSGGGSEAGGVAGGAGGNPDGNPDGQGAGPAAAGAPLARTGFPLLLPLVLGLALVVGGSGLTRVRRRLG